MNPILLLFIALNSGFTQPFFLNDFSYVVTDSGVYISVSASQIGDYSVYYGSSNGNHSLPILSGIFSANQSFLINISRDLIECSAFRIFIMTKFSAFNDFLWSNISFIYLCSLQATVGVFLPYLSLNESTTDSSNSVTISIDLFLVTISLPILVILKRKINKR